MQSVFDDFSRTIATLNEIRVPPQRLFDAQRLFSDEMAIIERFLEQNNWRQLRECFDHLVSEMRRLAGHVLQPDTCMDANSRSCLKAFENRQSVPQSGEQVDLFASELTPGPLDPPLKWAGGKRWLVPEMAKLWRPHKRRRFVEPFCGALAITLGLQPNEALLNDINPHLIAFHQWLQRGLEIDIPLEHDESAYYRCRSRFNDLIKNGGTDSKEAASLFYYLNRTCFNGLCRFNGQGGFNVPFGAYKQITYRRDFRSYRNVFSKWTFTCGDFEKVSLEPGDFVYADPPYDVEFTSYAKEGFTFRDQERLAMWLAKHPGPVVISNQATPRIIELYRDFGFTISQREGPRRINNTGDRTPAAEVLASKNL